MNSSRTTGQFFTVPESMLKSSGTVWPVALYGRFSFFSVYFSFLFFYLLCGGRALGLLSVVSFTVMLEL